MEIDIRESDHKNFTKIRFSDEHFIEVPNQEYIEICSGAFSFGVPIEEVPDLIKALQKYMELYGEKEKPKRGIWYNTKDYDQYEIGNVKVMIWWSYGNQGGPYPVDCVHGWGGVAECFKIV